MKKTLFAMALLASFAGLADVESANICGYQKRGLKNGKFVWCCGTFASMQRTQANMTLADIALDNENGVYLGEVTLSLFDGNGSNLKLTSEDTELWVGRSASFYFLSQSQIDEEKEDPEYDGHFDGVGPGWYLSVDEEYQECFNNYKIPYGAGYAVKQSESGYSMLYAGDVVKSSNMPSIALKNGKFVWTGNAAPKKMNLADFTLSNENGVYLGEVTLSLFDENGSNLKLTADDTDLWIGKSASFYYLSQEQIDEEKADPEYDGHFDGVLAGWYHSADEYYKECFNEYKIEIGLGFALKQSESGYSFNLPSALPEEKAE